MPTYISNHIPVLLEATLDVLAPKQGATYLDLTAGYAGHASRILEATNQYEGSVLVDRDENAINELSKQFGEREVQIMQSDFARAAQQLLDENRTFDIILADLGVSSPHLDNASRGFSFRESGPLDMRMDQSQEIDAYTLVNLAGRNELIRILKDYGDEFRAPKIVDAIISNRPVKTTDQLAKIIERAVNRGGYNKVHPATKTFQALRIAVNDELGQLQQALPKWVELLKPGGRLAVISFHSLEDRIVKQYFADNSDHYEAELHLLNKKPLSASQDELVLNPRARSAKLRAVAKIKTERSLPHANTGKK